MEVSSMITTRILALDVSPSCLIDSTLVHFTSCQNLDPSPSSPQNTSTAAFTALLLCSLLLWCSDTAGDEAVRES